MKTISYEQIVAFNPCYDPVKYIAKDFEAPLGMFLALTEIPAKDRLWCVVREPFLTLKQIHYYGLACARLSEKYSTDDRVKQCNDTVERYLKGQATAEELNTAWSAAESARSAAESAWSAAWSAQSAAESARSAAESAWSAAWSAQSARSAAESAQSAAWSAQSAAESAAESAARSAMGEKQCETLIEILRTIED